MTRNFSAVLIFIAAAAGLSLVVYSAALAQEQQASVSPYVASGLTTTGVFHDPGALTAFSFAFGKLTISANGEITFPPGAQPSELAKEFAAYLQTYMQRPSMTKEDLMDAIEPVLTENWDNADHHQVASIAAAAVLKAMSKKGLK